MSQEMRSLPNSIKHHKCSLLGVLTTHESNTPFSCHKTLVQNDVWQSYFTAFLWRCKLCYVPPENKLPPYKLSKSQLPTRHQVCAGCLLSRQILLGHLDPWIWHWLVIPKCWKGIITLCCVKSQKRAGLITCSIAVCLFIRRMPNGQI